MWLLGIEFRSSGRAASALNCWAIFSASLNLFLLFCFVLFFWFFFFFFFWDRVSLCSPGCPGTHSVDQVGLKLRNLPASASRVLGLKAPNLFLFLLCSQLLNKPQPTTPQHPGPWTFIYITSEKPPEFPRSQSQKLFADGKIIPLLQHEANPSCCGQPIFHTWD